MKTATAIVLALFVLPAFSQLPVQPPAEAEILRAKGEAAKIIIEKAYSILSHARVFASRAIGDDRVPTSSCWAMTVIVKHDPEALRRLTESLSYLERPEPKLYALAAMFSVDPKTAERWPLSSFPEAYRERPVHTMDGCNYSETTFESALEEIYRPGHADTFLTTFHPSIRPPTLHVMKTEQSNPAHFTSHTKPSKSLEVIKLQPKR
ncbi:MAG TPA: hypothetical protein VGE29_19105 [Prosthecobacter sp.]